MNLVLINQADETVVIPNIKSIYMASLCLKEDFLDEHDLIVKFCSFEDMKHATELTGWIIQPQLGIPSLLMPYDTFNGYIVSTKEQYARFYQYWRVQTL